MGKGSQNTTPAKLDVETKDASKNNGYTDIQVYIHGKSIDVTGFSKKHPGGAKALHIYNRRDASEVFDAYHSPAARARMEKFGKSSPEAPVTFNKRTQEIIADYRVLRDSLHTAGMFDANIPDEILKVAIPLVLYTAGIMTIHNTAWTYLGAFLIALAQQQLGWLGHDYSHHAVFQSVFANDAVSAVCGWLQGYELYWWKARHNTHHISTNEEGNDPDIVLMPLFHYVFGRTSVANSLNFLQRQQAFYFIPTLALLNVYWRVESLMYIVPRMKTMWPNFLALAVGHYAFMYWIYASVGFWPFYTMMLMKGFMTGTVVFATHYGEDRLPIGHGLSLVEQTARTSRNILGGTMMDYYSGFISAQVEHHMFPTMPRVNYPTAQPLIKTFLKKYDIPFNEDGLIECMRRNVVQLQMPVDMSH